MWCADNRLGRGGIWIHRLATQLHGVFLHSDAEYEWPIRNFISLTGCALTILTLGVAPLVYRRLAERRHEAMGDWSVWPFVRRSDYDAALRRPRLLSGRVASFGH